MNECHTIYFACKTRVMMLFDSTVSRELATGEVEAENQPQAEKIDNSSIKIFANYVRN